MCESHKCEIGAGARAVARCAPVRGAEVESWRLESGLDRRPCASSASQPCSIQHGGRIWTYLWSKAVEEARAGLAVRRAHDAEARGGARIRARAARISKDTNLKHTHTHSHPPTHAHTHTLNTKQHLYGNTCAPLAPRGRPGSVYGCARRHTLPRAPARLARETARVATERLPLPELHGVIDYKLRFVPDVGIDATHEDVQQPIARHAHLRPR